MVQKCHYEVLGVTRDASPEEIKKAYRRVALEWHPDKNLDRLSEATVQFQLIQQAFEVLSDPNERAWYDEHRTVILNGGLSSDFQEEIVNIQPYYSRSCFKGFHNDPTGFYQVFTRLFEEVSREDQLFWPKEDYQRPVFGNSKSDYKEVVEPFYSHWSAFDTFKPYTWCNVYDPNTADNRKILKLILKENKKMQNYARRRRNQEIRNFVAYVRKLDPRVAAYKEVLREKEREKQAKLQEQISLQRAKRKKEMAKYMDQYQEDFKLLEEDLKELENSVDQMFEGSNEEDQDQPLYCLLCNKHFRSEKAFANHEKSKKHQETLQVLKQQVAEDEGLIESMEQLELDSSEEEDPPPAANKKKKNKHQRKMQQQLEEESSVESTEQIEEQSEEEEDQSSSAKKKKNKRQRKLQQQLEEESPVESTEQLVDKEQSEEDLSSTSSAKKKKNKRQRKLQQQIVEESTVESGEQIVDKEQSEEEDQSSNAKKKKNKRQRKLQQQILEESTVESTEQIEEQSEEDQSSNSKKKKNKRQRKQQQADVAEEDTRTEEPAKPTDKKKMKKQQRKQQQSAPPDLSEEEKEPTVRTEDPDEGHDTKPPKLKGKKAKEARKKAAASQEEKPVIHKCTTCTQEFPTRNKLFDHLKSSGHQRYIGPSKGRS